MPIRQRASALNRRLPVGLKIGGLLGLMLLIAGLNVGAVYYYQSQVDTLSNSVHYAGQQRTLAQQMAFIGFQLSKGHNDQEIMQQAVQKYDRNLKALTTGGTINGQTLQPAPQPVRDELKREQKFWKTYKQHAQTLISEEPYNPQFQESLRYIVENQNALIQASSRLESTYASAGEKYAGEHRVAKNLESRSRRIIKLAIEIKHATSKPGTGSQEKLQAQQSDHVKELQRQLKLNIQRYNGALTALESGGTYKGLSLNTPPKNAKPIVTTLTKRWTKFRPHAKTIATQPRLNPTFWQSLTFIEKNTDKLKTISNDAVVAFADVSTSRIAFLKQLLIGLFAVDLLVFLLGTYFARRFIGTPIDELSEVARTLANGRLDVNVNKDIQLDFTTDNESTRDELMQLGLAFENLQDYLSTVADQASAIANQDFDDPVLEENVPGEFGNALNQMQRDLRELVTELETMNEELEAEAEACREVMERAAAGDLTQRMDPSTENKAMQEIATAFNTMMEDIEETITRIRDFADEVAVSSEKVTTSTEEIKEASEQVSESVQEISVGADEQSENLTRVNTEMQNLSGTIEEVASSADQVATTAKQAVDLGTDGRDAANQAIEEMNAIETNAEKTITEVESLAEEMDEIGEIVELIREITEQTNLLALNASIEAARAGEAGEGFAVVADEIKTLAEETADAAEEIETLITEIQTSTTDAVADIREMGNRLNRGADTIQDALQALDQIADQVQETNDGIQEISDATDEQATSTEEVVSMIEEVTSVAQQTSSEAETVSAAAEEQTSSLMEVSEGVQTLAQRADELQDVLDSFTVNRVDYGPSQTSIPQESVTTDGGSLSAAQRDN